MKRCPECQTELQSELSPYGLDGGGTYVVVLRCPNVAMHGTTVPCENDCGEQVLNPRQHYSYTPGLIGSGRWRCFPKRQVNAWR